MGSRAPGTPSGSPCTSREATSHRHTHFTLFTALLESRGAQVPVDAEGRGSGPVPATLQCREGQAGALPAGWAAPSNSLPVWASSVERTAVPPAWAPRGLLRRCMEVLGGCLPKGLDSLLLSPPQRDPPALLQKKEAGRCWCCRLWGAALEAWAARSRQSPHLPGPAPLRSHVPCRRPSLHQSRWWPRRPRDLPST